ncbi:MAG TPA: hypothetical protein VGG98_00520 [Solirubrobacteraceae bacterium]
MLPFWISISLLSIFQGALVALPGVLAAPALERLGGRRWAVIPPASVIVFVFGARAAERASAEWLTYLALLAVPLLAAWALGWLSWGARPGRALLVVPVFLLAWVDRGGLAGEGAALLLSALSCVSLGVFLATVTPVRWLAAGIVAMALADTALVVSDLLQRPNDVLNAAHPAAGLPRLQSAVFGSAVMGYGDLFVAAVLGGLLAASSTRPRQLRAARLVALIALGLDLLFLAIEELPATLPVALALIVVVVRGGGVPGGELKVLKDRSRTAPGFEPPGSPLAPDLPRRSRTPAER